MTRLLILGLLALSITTFAQNFSYNKNIKGTWGKWEQHNGFVYKLTGTINLYNEFIIYAPYDHPSKYFFKVTMFGGIVETDKKRKRDAMKSGKWYEYPAMVEYYTFNMVDRFEDVILDWPISGYANHFEKHTVPATVTIPPYKDKPVNYNVWFEDLGLAIQIK